MCDCANLTQALPCPLVMCHQNQESTNSIPTKSTNQAGVLACQSLAQLCTRPRVPEDTTVTHAFPGEKSKDSQMASTFFLGTREGCETLGVG